MQSVNKIRLPNMFVGSISILSDIKMLVVYILVNINLCLKNK